MITVIVLVLNDAIEKLEKARREEKEENFKENKKIDISTIKKRSGKKEKMNETVKIVQNLKCK